MIRILGILILAVAAFAGTIAALLAMSGNLNSETVAGLLGRDEARQGRPMEEDPVGPWARRLQEETERLRVRTAELEEWESRLTQREQDLAQLRDEIIQRQEQLKQSLDRLDMDHTERVREVATSLENMKDKEAALVMEGFPPEEASEILRIIKARQRGNILNAMDQDKRTLLLQIMQERGY